MRWIVIFLALSGSTFAQSIVLAQAFGDAEGAVHFAVTKVVQREGAWRKHPLEVGTIIDPPRVRRAYPLRRFGETVLFVLPQTDNLRAYWSYNVHDGFVPGLAGRPLTEVISSLVVPTVPSEATAPVIAAQPARVARRQVRQQAPDRVETPQDGRATHQLMVDALRALAASDTVSKN
jgi:hypothetical protein